jgi:IS30 family transposase
VTLAVRLAGKTAAETISVMLAVFARIEPALRKSITFDNDTAFAQHALLRTMRAMTTWFCDAYASWQKGGVENANRIAKAESLRDVFVTVGAFSLAQVRRQKLRSGRVREPQGSRAARYCVGTIERGRRSRA